MSIAIKALQLSVPKYIIYCPNSPRLVERPDDVTLDDLVAHVTQIPEQLVVVGLAVGQALALKVAVAQEWLLALGAHKVLHAPVLAWKLSFARMRLGIACFIG